MASTSQMLDNANARVRSRLSRRTTNHAGRPLRDSQDFFAVPSDAIGEIISAESTLKLGQRERGVLGYWGWVIAMSYGFGGALSLVELLGRNPEPINTILIYGTIALPIVAIIVATMGPFHHYCSYVGREGFALYELNESRTHTPSVKQVHFSNAIATRTIDVIRRNGRERERRIVWLAENGVSVGWLEYSYAWIDWTKRTKHVSRLLDAVQEAWGMFLFSKMLKHWETNEPWRFGLRESDVIWLAPNRMTIQIGNSSAEIRRGELRSITVFNGVITIKTAPHCDLSDLPRLRFQASELDSSQVFIEAINYCMLNDSHSHPSVTV